MSKRLVGANRAGTLLVCVVIPLAAVRPDQLGALVQVVSLVLFAAGCGAFVWAYSTAVRRSRHEHVTSLSAFGGMPGASRPRRLEFRLHAVLQFAVGLAGAAIRPFSALAFGILAGVFGLGLMSLWGAACGSFRSRGQSQGRQTPGQARRHG